MIDHKKQQKSPVLLHITDLHLQALTENQSRGLVTQTTFESVLHCALNDPRWPPDGILITGDIVEDQSSTGYERFWNTLKIFNLPILCIPGNHDNPSLMAEFLGNPPFQVGGNKKLGNWRILLLSSFQQNEHSGTLSQDELAALEESLKKSCDEHVMICMHHQPLTMGSTWLDRLGLQDSQQFLTIINRHKQVRAVVWGHVHQASDRTINTVRFLSTPSTCYQFLPKSDSFSLDDQPPGMRWLNLGDNGHIETVVAWVTPILISET